MLIKLDREILNDKCDSLYKFERQLNIGKTDHFNSIEEYKKSVLDEIIPDNLHHRYLLTESEQLTGVLDFKLYTYDGKVEFAKVQLHHVTGNISAIQTIEIGYLFIALQDQYDITSVIAESPETKLDDFFEKLGGFKVNQLNFYKLDLQAIDKSLLDKWLENDDIQDKNYSLVFSEFIPEDKIIEFTNVFTELMNDVIREGKQERFQETPDGLMEKMNSFRSRGIKLVAYLLYYRVELVGMTFTLIRNGQDIASQEMTGIRREFRGKKFGQYLKAKMLAKMKTDYPAVKYLTTNCYDSNRPIVDINLRMGYRLEKKVSQFRLTKVALVKMASR